MCLSYAMSTYYVASAGRMQILHLRRVFPFDVSSFRRLINFSYYALEGYEKPDQIPCGGQYLILAR